MTPERYLVVGLGNPGREYERTRHNVGWLVLDALVRRHSLGAGKQERKAWVFDGSISGRRVLLAKPLTYMNLSGEAVRPLMDFYKIPLERLIVVQDDLDTPAGVLRIRPQGGHGGQNGIRNIIQHVGTQTFARVRCGIGRPPGPMAARDYVLQAPQGDAGIAFTQMIDKAADAVEVWLGKGLETAMNQFNGGTDGA